MHININFRIIDIIKEVEHQMLEHGEKLNRIQHIVEQVAKKQREYTELQHKTLFKSLVDVVFVIVSLFFTLYFANIWIRDSTKG